MGVNARRNIIDELRGTNSIRCGSFHAILSRKNDQGSREEVVFGSIISVDFLQIVEQRKADEARWRASAQRIQAEVTELLNLTGMVRRACFLSCQSTGILRLVLAHSDGFFDG